MLALLSSFDSLLVQPSLGSGRRCGCQQNLRRLRMCDGADDAVPDTLDMSLLARRFQEVRDAEDQARAEPYHPIHNPTGFDVRVRARRRPRPKRAAARVAMERMYEQGGERPCIDSISSAESDGDGDDAPPPPPPPLPRPEPSLAELDARLHAVWGAMKRGELGRLLLKHESRLRVV